LKQKFTGPNSEQFACADVKGDTGRAGCSTLLPEVGISLRICPQDFAIGSFAEDIVSASISLLFCPFDLYFLGMGLGVPIIIGGTLQPRSILFVLAVFFLWLHGQPFGSAKVIGWAPAQIDEAE
jgi:hypothetical protein